MDRETDKPINPFAVLVAMYIFAECRGEFVCQSRGQCEADVLMFVAYGLGAISSAIMLLHFAIRFIRNQVVGIRTFGLTADQISRAVFAVIVVGALYLHWPKPAQEVASATHSVAPVCPRKATDI